MNSKLGIAGIAIAAVLVAAAVGLRWQRGLEAGEGARLAEVGQVFASFLDAYREALASYSDEELAFLLEYTRRVTVLAEREAAKLNAASAVSPSPTE